MNRMERKPDYRHSGRGDRGVELTTLNTHVRKKETRLTRPSSHLETLKTEAQLRASGERGVTKARTEKPGMRHRWPFHPN